MCANTLFMDINQCHHGGGADHSFNIKNVTWNKCKQQSQVDPTKYDILIDKK